MSESKHIPGVLITCHPVPYNRSQSLTPLGEVTHAVPLQYCPEGQVVGVVDVDVVDVTHADPFQYCPLGQSVDVVALQ